MSLNFIKFKLRKETARYKQNYAYVPSTNSFEYRKEYQKEWEFRLNAEFIELKKKGWNMAFMTLTYDDRHLPKIPKKLFKNKEEYRQVPCFSRTDVRNWIDRIRQYCKYHYKMTGANAIKYFVASEYGSNTHRPHYHAIFAWPQFLSYEKMHKLCTECWENGILFPRNPDGDYNSKTKKRILPFEIIGNAAKALKYISKYVSKDLDFINELKTLNLNRKLKLFKSIQHFHIQSRSFGFELLRNMNNDEKYNLLENGHAFQGDGTTFKCPKYIREKILFFNEYVKDKYGIRKIYKRPTKFMEEYREYIFNRKASWYDKIFANVNDPTYFKNSGFTEEKSNQFTEIIKELQDQCINLCNKHGFNFNMFSLGQYATVYDGIDNAYIFQADNKQELIKLWYNRFLKPNEWTITPKPIQFLYCELFKNYISYAQAINALCGDINNNKKEEIDSKIREMQDYFNNQIK